jgi:hypothetical protein
MTRGDRALVANGPTGRQRHSDVRTVPDCPGQLRTVYVRVRTNGRPTWDRRGVLCDSCGEFWRDEE